jgi:tRNA(adenine34) deaminase
MNKFTRESSIEIFFDTFFKLSTNYPKEVPSFSQIYSKDWEFIAESFNLVESSSNTSFHSEVLCIQKSQEIKKDKYLYHYTLLTLLEPCTMCSGAIIQSRIENVLYFAELEKIPGISSYTPEIIVKSNHFPKLEFLPRPEASEYLKKFFINLRLEGKRK